MEKKKRERNERRKQSLFIEFVNVKKTSILYLYKNAQVSQTIEYQFFDYLEVVLVG